MVENAEAAREAAMSFCDWMQFYPEGIADNSPTFQDWVVIRVEAKFRRDG